MSLTPEKEEGKRRRNSPTNSLERKAKKQMIEGTTITYKPVNEGIIRQSQNVLHVLQNRTTGRNVKTHNPIADLALFDDNMLYKISSGFDIYKILEYNPNVVLYEFSANNKKVNINIYVDLDYYNKFYSQNVIYDDDDKNNYTIQTFNLSGTSKNGEKYINIDDLGLDKMYVNKNITKMYYFKYSSGNKNIIDKFISEYNLILHQNDDPDNIKLFAFLEDKLTRREKRETVLQKVDEKNFDNMNSYGGKNMKNKTTYHKFTNITINNKKRVVYRKEKSKVDYVYYKKEYISLKEYMKILKKKKIKNYCLET